MQGPKSTSQRIALTRLEGIGRLPMALWSILEAQREETPSRGTMVQKAHGQHPPRLGVEIHQRLGVPQISQGLQVQMLQILPWERLLMALWPQGGTECIHQRLGVPRQFQNLGVQMIPILPWARLPTALKPLGRPEFIPSRCDLQNLLPPSPGSQQSIPA